MKRSKAKIVNDEKVGYGVPTLIHHSYVHQTKEFFSNSTLHGVRYIAEDGRPFRERFMWFCFIVTGIIAAIVIIMDLWEKFQTNPTITGLDTDFHNQLLIFPTVMVCPVKPFNPEVIQEVAEKQLGIEPELNNTKYNEFLERLPGLSYKSMSEFSETLRDISSDDVIKSANLRLLAFSTAISCNETFTLCKYKDEEIDCCEYFQPMFSENGFCYVFNGKYRDTATGEEAIPEQYSLFETDKKWGLKFVPALVSEIYLHSFQEGSGHDFKPNVKWEPNFAVELLISMKQTYTTEQARQLTVSQRKCIFEDEFNMKYRKEQYTFSGCMRECRIRNSMKFCGCVAPFYISDRHSFKYCPIEKYECLAKNMLNITDIDSCLHCELGCANTVFDIEKFTKIAVTDQKMKDYINIEYLTWPIIRYKREVLFGWVDLLVSFGGIAGLFLGFSLLSFVEIVYYFTLRVCCMMYKNRSELEDIIDEKKGKSLKYTPDWETEFSYHRKYQEAIEAFKVKPLGEETKYTNSVLIGQQSKHVTDIPKLKMNKVKPVASKPAMPKTNYNQKANWNNVWATQTEYLPYGQYLP
ncbi:sodium channel protein Nach [Culicoides brevitarsis]|uniref:sodium channel protein Nach n=1 Tax=Culicoides brevitarsis TaxID=469753 RepID=UPI00307B7BA4